MTSIITTAPTSYMAVTLDEAKSQLRELTDDNNARITRLVKAAVTYLERRYSISIMTQSRIQKMASFYTRVLSDSPYNANIPLLYGPIQSVTTFAYTDENGVSQTLTLNSTFGTAGMMAPTAGAQDVVKGFVYPIDSWPSTKWIPEAVRITYVAGFGTTPAHVPEPIREAVLRVVAHLNDQPLDQLEGSGLTMVKFDLGIDSLMSSYEQYQHLCLEELTRGN